MLSFEKWMGFFRYEGLQEKIMKEFKGLKRHRQS